MYGAGRFYDVFVIKAYRTFAADILAIQHGAVGAFHVLDVELLVLRFNLEVPPGNEPQLIRAQSPGQVTPAYNCADLARSPLPITVLSPARVISMPLGNTILAPVTSGGNAADSS